jgi:hypothetical protein
MVITNDYEAFTYVRDMLIKQNEQSTDTNANCQYRGYSENLCQKIREESEEWVINNPDKANKVSNDFLDAEDAYFYEKIYELPFDTKCAAGFLINDNFYQDHFEGNAITDNSQIWQAVKISNLNWKTTESSFNLVKTLQSIHDNNQPEDWQYLLSKVESNFDSTYTYTGKDWEMY